MQIISFQRPIRSADSDGLMLEIQRARIVHHFLLLCTVAKF